MDISEKAAIHGFLRPDRSAIAPKIGAVNAISRPATETILPHCSVPLIASAAMER